MVESRPGKAGSGSFKARWSWAGAVTTQRGVIDGHCDDGIATRLGWAERTCAANGS